MLIQETTTPLTVLAHEKVSEVIGNDSFAIDLTVGNGHDTAFLARSVGVRGRVLGFDIQDCALKLASNRLAEAALRDRVILFSHGHEAIASCVPEAWKGEVAAVMMNLGYLPGGDKMITTRPETTLAALESLRPYMRIGAIVAIIVYRGHCGGAEEAQAVENWVGQFCLDDVRIYAGKGRGEEAPRLYLIRVTR